MKVLEAGKPPKGYEGLWECIRCGCVFELDGKDKSPSREDVCAEGEAPAWITNCPNCKGTVYRKHVKEWP
jgi:hypothetical protein